MNKIHNPASMPPGIGYSHGIELAPGARVICTSGQVGVDADGVLAESFEDQADQVFRNILTVLSSAGMGREDIIKLNVFMTRRDDLPAYGPILERHLGDLVPTDTLVLVSGLVREACCIEIDCWAARA